jgi:hypothetical protein
VIKGYFLRLERTEAVGTSGYHTDLVVETLDDTVGYLAFGPEPIQE